MKKQELMLGENLQRKDDVQPVIEPEIIETEVVETDDVEKEEQESRRPVTWETDFQRYFGVSPFPLSAEKIAFLVQRIDWEGPQLMGAYYPSTLRTECGLLLPQPVYGFWDWRYPVTLETWARNIGFFRCAAIGKILWIYKMGEMEDANCPKKR